MGHKYQGLRVPEVRRSPGSKGLFRDKMFSRTCVISSLTPEEGPSCFQLTFQFTFQISFQMSFQMTFQMSMS